MAGAGSISARGGRAGSSAMPGAALLAALAAVTLWAGTPAATKIAVGGLAPEAVGLLRTLLVVPLALPLLLLGRHWALPSERTGRLWLVLAAVSGFVVFPVLFSLGVARTSAGHAALLIAVSPIFTGLFAATLQRRFPGRRWWLGAAVAMFGVVLLVETRYGLTAGESGLLGDFLVIAACFAASIGYVAGARASIGVGGFAVSLWALLGASLLLAPTAPWLISWSALTALGWAGWSALLYLSLLSSLLGYAIWYWALARDDIGRTAQVQFLQPLISLLIAVVLLGEVLTGAQLLAGALIIAGVVLAQKRRPTT